LGNNLVKNMQLGIGTAQFGMNYGVANKDGIVIDSEINNILTLAKKNNINLLDTARLYGCSEEAIGLTKISQNFKIITKTNNFKSFNSQQSKKQLIEDFEISLKLLNVKKIYGLLFHNADDLLTDKSSDLWQLLLNLKENNLVEKIGISIYNSYQIDEILKKFKIDIIQVPINIYDQRLINSGHIKKMQDLNIEIHARSIFLQGLLTMECVDLNNFFSPILNQHKKYWNFLKNNKLSPIKICLDFIKENNINYAIVGVNNSSQLLQIIDNYNQEKLNIDYSLFNIEDENFINPANWKLK
jgi:aryl-alcohol dehydrogenase-like predicted oxidoreductase